MSLIVSRSLYGLDKWKPNRGGMMKAFQSSILTESGTCPANLRMREYYNFHLIKTLKKYNTNHYSTFRPMKASFAERVTRTLKKKLFKYYSPNGSYTRTYILQENLSNYKRTKHSKNWMRPCDVTPNTTVQSYSHLKIAGLAKLLVDNILWINKAKHAITNPILLTGVQNYLK